MPLTSMCLCVTAGRAGRMVNPNAAAPHSVLTVATCVPTGRPLDENVASKQLAPAAVTEAPPGTSSLVVLTAIGTPLPLMHVPAPVNISV
jgi:hypothetical protein